MTEFDIHMNYKRTIGELDNPDAHDISLTVYHNDETYTIHIWIDYETNTVKFDKGAFHDQPVEKELIDVLIKRFGLETFKVSK